MYFGSKLIALLIGTYAVSIEADNLRSTVATQYNILDFMERTSDISNRNPQRSMECFGYYIPILNGITAEYERNYGVCLQKSEENKARIDKSTSNDRKDIEASAINACVLLNDCNNFSNSIDYFECYVKYGSENSKTMYTISSNASDVLARIREEYRLIENEEAHCINTAERVYVEDTANTYEELQNCIAGKTAVPTQAPTNSPTEISTPSASFALPASLKGQLIGLPEIKSQHSKAPLKPQ